jgi:hypothetical protein
MSLLCMECSTVVSTWELISIYILTGYMLSLSDSINVVTLPCIWEKTLLQVLCIWILIIFVGSHFSTINRGNFMAVMQSQISLYLHLNFLWYTLLCYYLSLRYWMCTAAERSNSGSIWRLDLFNTTYSLLCDEWWQLYFFDLNNPLSVYCLSCCIEDAKYVSTVLQISLILADFILQFCQSYLRSIEGLNFPDIEVCFYFYSYTGNDDCWVESLLWFHS